MKKIKKTQEDILKKQDLYFVKKMRNSFIEDKKEILYNERNKILEETEDKKKIKDLKKEYRKKYKSEIVEGNHQNSEGNIIELKNVNKYYFTKSSYEHILKNINLKIKEGQIIIILGASGSGKSTLLNIISGLISANSGDVIVANKNLTLLNESRRTDFRAKNISFVFQSYNLISTLNVIENIKVGYNLRDKSIDKELNSIDEILEILDLKNQKSKYPYQLSGGQNQRVSIGRALAKRPKILFADEPTGALDEQKGRDALQLLLDINEKLKTTLVIVTHNSNFSKVGDVVLKIKDGTIAQTIVNKTKISAKEVKWS